MYSTLTRYPLLKHIHKIVYHRKDLEQMLGMSPTKLGIFLKTMPFPVVVAVGRQVIPMKPFHKWLAFSHPDIAAQYPCPPQTPRAIYQKTSFSVPEVRQLLGIGKTSSYELAKDPTFEVLRVDKHFRITQSSFDKWLHSQDYLFEFLEEEQTEWHPS